MRMSMPKLSLVAGCMAALILATIPLRAAQCPQTDLVAYSMRELPNVDKVKLTRGVIGFFRAVSCGGSCAPANLWLGAGSAVYQIQLRLYFSAVDEKKQQRIITEIANSAIAAGPGEYDWRQIPYHSKLPLGACQVSVIALVTRVDFVVRINFPR